MLSKIRNFLILFLFPLNVFAAIAVRETTVVSVTNVSPASPRLFSNSTSVTAGDRIVASISAKGTGSYVITAVKVLNSGSTVDTLTLDAGPINNGSSGGVTLWVYSAKSSGGSLTDIEVTFTGSPQRMTVDASSYSGLAKTFTSVNTFGSNTGSGTSITLDSANLTTDRSTMLFQAVAADSTSTITFNSGSANTAPGTGLPTNILSTRSGQEDVTTATSNFNRSASLSVSRVWASVLVAYNSGPSKIVFLSGPTNIDKNACNVIPYSFVLRSRNGTTSVSPFGTTNFTVGSDNASAYVEIAGCPICGSTSNPKSTSLDSTHNQIDVFPVDAVVGTGKVLTVSYVSGGDTLTGTTTTYDVNASSNPAYCNVTRNGVIQSGGFSKKGARCVLSTSTKCVGQ